MIFCKVAALVIICAAIWLTIHLLVTADDRAAGVVQPVSGQESLLKRVFSTPEPTPEPGPKFAR